MSALPLDALDCYRLGESGLLVKTHKDTGLAAQWLELAITKALEILNKQEEDNKKREQKEQQREEGGKTDKEDNTDNEDNTGKEDNVDNEDNTDNEDEKLEADEAYEPPEGFEEFLKLIAVPVIPFNMSNAYVLLAKAHTMVSL